MMSTTAFAWLSLLILPLSLHNVLSEDFQFVKIPQRREILPVGSNLTIDCTTNNQTAQTAVYYRRSVKSVKWKKIEAVNGIKVVQNGSVYTLVTLSRRNRGQYQCRARGSTNGTETKWPENVGIVIVRGRLNKDKLFWSNTSYCLMAPYNRVNVVTEKRPDEGGLVKGTRKPDSKVKEKKKPRNKKPGQKKPKPKKPGNKKTGKKRNNGKTPGQKRPGSKRPGATRPGNKRPRTKKPGVKRPGSKRGGAKRPGTTKKNKRKKGLKPLLKALKNLVSVNESSLAVLKCTARVQGGGQPIISWHRLDKMIGCSDKKDLRCSSVSRRYLITYSAPNTRGGSRKKYTSYLRIPKTRRARDRGIYVCMAKNGQGSTSQTIRLRIKKRSS